MGVTASEVRDASVRADALRSKYLLEHGWKETCQTPGAFWPWFGVLPDARQVLCDAETAFLLQQEITPESDDGEKD